MMTVHSGSNALRDLGHLVFVAALLAPVAALPARAEEDPHAACAAPPSYIPPELLERPVPLREGIGNSRDDVTSSSKDAQAFYNQGLNYLESYVWIEASRSFHQALRLDPNFAMAAIGLSRVYSGLDNKAEARRYFERAKTLAPGVSARERRMIDIREKQLAAIDNLEDAPLLLAYRKAIDDALAAGMDDPQLWLMRGNASEPTAAGRGQRGGAASVAFYERVLALVPDHASAHHYLVHSYETIGRIDQALAHGEQYARLAPSIPHAAHMWGHDLRRVGRVDDAIAQFKQADALERAYYTAEKIDPGFDWHHSHNLDLLAMCYQYKGQMKLAEATAREAVSLAAPDAYGTYNLKLLPAFLIHRGRYQEALDAARAMSTLEYPQARTVGHALVGQALIGLGRVDEAGKELTAAEQELASVPRVTMGVIPNRAVVEGWVVALRGEILERTGRMAEGRAVIEEAQRALRAAPGPDAWIQALFRLETMARSARVAGDWSLADYTARQMLDHDASYGGSHLALAIVLDHQSDTADATRELKLARSYWRDADDDLAELQVIEAQASTTAGSR
jgi:tetratricopeptide (TPR) repeat protein